MRQVIRNSAYLSVLLIALVGVPATAISRGQPPEEKKDNTGKEKEPTVEEQWHKKAEKAVTRIELEKLVDENWVKVKRIEKPLFYYTEPTRDHDRGSIWGWGEKGRPVALVKLRQRVDRRSTWEISITNTSGGKLRASLDKTIWWLENESVVEYKDIPNAPAPATDARQLQRQLKQLAQKFTGHEFWDPNNSRYDLRRLEKPLHAYKDEDTGVQAGALYTFANGVNPEIMLFIEARVDPKTGQKAAWQFLAGRTGGAELHLDYNDKEVFTAPRLKGAGGGPREPYWNTTISVD